MNVGRPINKDIRLQDRQRGRSPKNDYGRHNTSLPVSVEHRGSNKNDRFSYVPRCHSRSPDYSRPHSGRNNAFSSLQSRSP